MSCCVVTCVYSNCFVIRGGRHYKGLIRVLWKKLPFGDGFEEFLLLLRGFFGKFIFFLLMFDS